MDLNAAAWILVIMLSLALLCFLILAIILLIRLISIVREARKIVITGQGIAEKADGIVDNVKDMTSVGGLVKTVINSYTKRKKKN